MQNGRIHRCRKSMQTYKGTWMRSHTHKETDGCTGMQKASGTFTVKHTRPHAWSQRDKGTSSRSERHTDALARKGRKEERQKEARKNGQVERVWQTPRETKGRHTGAHTQITLAGVSPDVPFNAQGKLCCASVSGLKVSGGGWFQPLFSDKDQGVYICVGSP